MLGGKRPGAGRKKGSKSKNTLEKEIVLKELKLKHMKAVDVLFNAQMSLAVGQTFLYKFTYDNKKPQLVTDQTEIERYLQGEIAEADPEDEKDKRPTYYFLTTKEPNNQAIDSIYDRAFGKSIQAIELGGPGGKPLFDDKTKAKAKQAVREHIRTNVGKGRKGGD